MHPGFVLAGAAIVLHLLWRIVRTYFVRSPLDNLPGPAATSIILGNVAQIFRRDSWDFVRSLSEDYGPVAKIHAFLGERWLHVYDTKALYHIFIKDQDLYDRGEQKFIIGRLLIGPGLPNTTGETHRRQRKMLTPVFSAAHMRNLTPVFYDVAGKLRTAIETRVQNGHKELDFLGWMGRTALELLGQGTFGYSFDPLVQDTRNEFTEAVKAFVPALSAVPAMRFIAPYLKYLGPPWFRRILLDLVPNRKIQHVKMLVDTVSTRSAEIIRAKKAAIESGDQELLHTMGEGKDVMSILLKANLMASEEDRLPDDQLLAQIGTFIIAGVDTTSNSLARILHILAENPDAQQKLRSELHEAQERYGTEIPYDELSALPYLDAICRETLRLHAPVTFVTRQAMEDTVLPLSEPIRGLDGKTISELHIPKDTTVMINVRACNRNKDLWGEDADEWKPERWLQPLPTAVEEARVPGVYSNLMTFIGGGRSCIGFKFSQLEMKVVLAVLISAFKFELVPEKPIIWNFAGIAYPAVKEDDLRPAMYMNVSLATR